MNNTLIYLIGFSGSGKSTTAKEICKIIDAVVVSNNLFNNIIFNIINLRNAEVPDDLWESIFSVRKNILALLEKYHMKSKHYMFTNELIDGDPYDHRIYNSVINFSQRMNLDILFVVLHCDNQELIKRIQAEERCQENKITDSDLAMKRIEGKRLFVPKGALEFNNSHLSAKEVAKRIIEKIKNKRKRRRKLVGASVTNHVEKERTHG